MHSDNFGLRSPVIQKTVQRKCATSIVERDYRERGLRLERGVRHAIRQISRWEERFAPQIFGKAGISQQASRDAGNCPSVSFRHPVMLRSVRGSKLVNYPRV